MRCDQCNKFVAYDDSADPDVDLDISDGQITGTVRIVLTCADCGQDLKEYSFDVDAESGFDGEHSSEGHEVELSSVSATISTRSDCGVNRKTGKPNKYNPRYATTYYGYYLDAEVACSCGKKIEVELHDDVAASSMDELI